jgi:hypothetical protein
MTDEGHIKFQCHWTEQPPLPAHLVTELNWLRSRLYRAGLIGYYPELQVSYGNLSARALDPDEFMITGTQTGNIPTLTVNHYTLVTDYDIDANSVSCTGPIQASSETLTHAAIYELDEAFCAVVHVHSDPLWERSRNSVPTTRDDVSYGTPEMAGEFRRLYLETDLRERRIAVMGGHEGGLISLGGSVAEAAQRLLAYQEKGGRSRNGPA